MLSRNDVIMGVSERGPKMINDVDDDEVGSTQRKILEVFWDFFDNFNDFFELTDDASGDLFVLFGPFGPSGPLDPLSPLVLSFLA